MSTYALVKALTDTLFKAEERRLDRAILALNQENKRLQGAQIDGFLHAGQFFLPKGVSLTLAGPGQAKTALHKDLIGEMLHHLKDRSTVQEEREFISQTLYKLLNPCRTQQDIRDALPECLVNCIPELARLPRQREAAFTIKDDPRALRQYEKILPKMEIYSAARLLY